MGLTQGCCRARSSKDGAPSPGAPTAVSKQQIPAHEMLEKKKHLAGITAAATATASKRPVKILCSWPGDQGEAKGSIPDGWKLVYFIRHGEGFHNVTARESKYKCDCRNGPSGKCPYLDPRLLDPDLTDVGEDQASQLGLETPSLKLQPKLFIVSPLRRAARTALLAWPHLAGGKNGDEGTPKVPFVALPKAREQSGLHMCDKRRNKGDIAKDMPQLDLSRMKDEEDAYFTPGARETDAALIQRCYDVLMEVETLDYDTVCIATHSTWLLATFNAVLTTQDPSLKKWFATGEMRAVLLRWDRGDKSADVNA